MQQISKKTLLEEESCKINLAIGYVFLIISTLFIVLAGKQTDFQMVGSVMEFVLITIVAGCFGFFGGIRNILYMSKIIHNINVGNIRILYKKVANIEVRNKTTFDSNCRIEFEDESYKMVLRKVERTIKVGDECYVVYIGESKKIYHIYNAKKYKLDEELSKIFQRGKNAT